MKDPPDSSGRASAQSTNQPPLTRQQIAEAMGWTERHLFRILKEGTPNRSTASKLAKLTNKPVSEFLRQPRRKGRPRYDLPFPFKTFLVTVDLRDNPCRDLIQQLRTLYTLHDPGDERLPRLESVEMLVSYIEKEGIVDPSGAIDLWRQFKAWRIRAAANDIAEAIEQGDEFADEDMRKVLILLHGLYPFG